MERNNQKLLEGNVVEPESDASEVDRLRDELRRSNGERDALRAEVIRLQRRVNQIDAPAAHLRQTLEPLYQALRALFGDLELIEPPMAAAPQSANRSSPPAANDRTAAVWESWKRKLGDSAARIITALQEHGELNTTQLAIAAQMDKRTVTNAMYKMNQASLINKNGGKFSLKQL